MRTAVVSAHVEVPVFDLPEPDDAPPSPRANAMIAAARAPILYFGGGVPIARAERALREFAQRIGHPLGRDPEGARRPAHRRARLPRHARACTAARAANTAIDECDLLICVGARFDDRATGKIDSFAPRARIIHIDGDPAEIGKLKRPEVGMAGDLHGDPRPPDRDRPTCGRVAARCHAHYKVSWAPPYDAPGTGIYAPAMLKAIVGGRGRQPDLHLRRRPAPDVGGAALPLQPAAGASDQRRPRHDGLRHPGRHRRVARRSGRRP